MSEALDALASPRVGVCLAAYNGAAFIDEQLDSILGQHGVEVRVFVSVDRSTDGTEALVATRAARDSRIELLPGGQRFGSAAPNFFRLLRDVPLQDLEFLSFADQDDVWHVDKLSRAVKQMQGAGAAGYSCNVMAFWADGTRLLVDKAQPQREWDHLFEAAGPGCTYVLSQALAQALQDRVKEQANALAEVGYHDWFVYAFARANGFAWIIDPVPGMDYRQHAANQLGVNRGLRAFMRRASPILAGHWLQQARAIADTAGARQALPATLLALGPPGLLRLAFRAASCRRRRRDQYLFFLMCIAVAARGGVRS